VTLTFAMLMVSSRAGQGTGCDAAVGDGEGVEGRHQPAPRFIRDVSHRV